MNSDSTLNLKIFNATATSYYPDPSALEGGFVDERDKQLCTLQEYLAGSVSYVSVAMDKTAFPYGTVLRIPEIENKYKRYIEFRVVDTGSAFTSKGTSRIDICSASEKDSLDVVLNGPVTLMWFSILNWMK